MTTCRLCSNAMAVDARLSFYGVERSEHRPAKRLRLELDLCQRCANDVLKHLKRRVPLRLFEVG